MHAWQHLLFLPGNILRTKASRFKDAVLFQGLLCDINLAAAVIAIKLKGCGFIDDIKAEVFGRVEIRLYCVENPRRGGSG